MKNPSRFAGLAPALQPSNIPGDNLSEILRNIVDVVCIIDTLGIFQFVSPAAKRLFGYEPGEMVGQPFSQFILPEDVALTRNYLSRHGLYPVGEHFHNRYRHKNGSVVPVSWSGQWNATEQCFYCVGRDGSGRKAQEDRLMRVQQLVGVANFEYDPVNDRFTYISRNIFSITGIPNGRYDLVNFNNLIALVHPDDREALRQQLLSQAPTEGQGRYQYRLIQPDGNILYISHTRQLLFDKNGRHYKTVGTFQDITAQKLSELALHKSEKRFRSLVQGGTDILGILSPDGRYTYVGATVEQHLGYKPEDVQGKNVLEFLHPEDAGLLPLVLERTYAEKQFRCPPFRFRNKAGEWRWIESSLTDMTGDPDIGGIVCNSRDVTDNKIKNDRMRELSLIAQQSMHAILITNRENKVTWANEACCIASEYTLEEMVGKTPAEIFDRDNNNGAIFAETGMLLYQGQSVQTELLCYSKSGKPYWMNLQIQPVFNETKQVVKYLAMGKNITERKKAEEELRVSEQRFKALVQEGSDLTTIVDENGIFTYVSESVAKWLDYNTEDLLGKNIFSFIHPEDIGETIAGVERVRNNTSINGVQHRFRRKDGSWVWLESKGTNHYANPLIRGMIVNARDITDRVELQKRLDAALLNKQKEITSAVIKAQETERSKLGLELHDNVNQVLTTVKLYNEMYLTGYHQDRSLLERSARYLQDCINEIRSISKRLSAPTLGRITLHDSICDLVASINLTNRLQIHFVPQNIDGLFIGEDLHLGIYRIIQEGLNNIIKYAAASEAKILICRTEESLTVTICDNGHGFNTSERRNGIGITNMQTRAENLNGRFSIESSPGKGCVVEVNLPL